ncbi:MAG: N-acyl homoserine lactonase family protein [Gammaproteobacteria bacterium]
MRGIKIKPLFHGNMHVDKDLLITGHPDLLLTRSNHSKNRVWCEAPSFTYIIEHPDGRMLFDASIHKHWEDQWLPEYKELAPYDDYTEEQQFEGALKAAGLGPEDIDYVFLSHLHVDHAGNAKLFDTANTTQILCHEDEYMAAANMEKDEHFFLRGDYDVPGLRFATLPGDIEIMKGITAISLPGHTAGTMALKIDLEHSGTVILTSDACYLKESYDDEVGSLIGASLEQWHRSMKKLKMLARANNATVIPGHDHKICHEGTAPLCNEPHLRVGGEYD